MNGKMILLILGGVVLVIAIALAALLLPVQKSAEPIAEAQTTIEPTQEVAMEPTNTAAPEAAALPTEQMTTWLGLSCAGSSALPGRMRAERRRSLSISRAPLNLIWWPCATTKTS